jgi:hypothetical protein
MLAEADRGILFQASKIVIEEFPQFSVVGTYGELLRAIREN